MVGFDDIRLRRMMIEGILRSLGSEDRRWKIILRSAKTKDRRFTSSNNPSFSKHPVFSKRPPSSKSPLLQAICLCSIFGRINSLCLIFDFELRIIYLLLFSIFGSGPRRSNNFPSSIFSPEIWIEDLTEDEKGDIDFFEECAWFFENKEVVRFARSGERRTFLQSRKNDEPRSSTFSTEKNEEPPTFFASRFLPRPTLSKFSLVPEVLIFRPIFYFENRSEDRDRPSTPWCVLQRNILKNEIVN